MQARIDARAASQRTTGPSLPMPRLRHNGETGEWLVKEVEGSKNAEAATPFKTDGGKWSGAVLRVAYMSQTKYKKDAPSQKMTREFTDFRNEPIELLKRTFGESGRTESVKVFQNYQEFKAAGMLKDEDGNDAGSAYDLKVCLYVWHFGRKQVIKLVCGGSARSEWFEYTRGKASGDDLVVSKPWAMSQPRARLLEQVVTEFASSPAETAKGMKYHRLSFSAAGLCDDAQLSEVWERQDAVKAWVDGWNEVNRKAHAEEAAPTAVDLADPKGPMPMGAARIVAERSRGDEISLDEIPF